MDESAVRKEGKYEVIWRDLPSAFSEETAATFFLEGCKKEMRAGQTLIDFGGHSRQTKYFLEKGLHVTLVSLSLYALEEEARKMIESFSQRLHLVQACLWQLPENLKSSYWIYCVGVLEYLPEDTIDLVLQEMAKRMRYGGYFSIGLKEDPLFKKLKLPPIVTLKGKSWWEMRLSRYFTVVREDLVAGEDFFNCKVGKKDFF